MPKSTKTPQSTTTRTRKSSTIPVRSTASSMSTPTQSSLSTLTHADIAHRAYELFLANGAAHGRDVEHWLQAENELRGRSVSTRN